MTQQQFEQYLNEQRESSFKVYVNELVKQFNQLTSNQQNFFLQNVVRRDANAKRMTEYARIVAMDKDPVSLMSLSYYDLVRISNEQLQSLPRLAEQPQHFSQTQSETLDDNLNASTKMSFKRVQHIIDNYCESKSNTTDPEKRQIEETFAQTNNFSGFMPHQGWKLHISADDMDDYARLCEGLIPALHKAGVAFKVVRPEEFESFMSGNQSGKAITIYPAPGFSLNQLSPQIQVLLNEPVNNQVQGDVGLGGRVFARYGAFISPNTITTPDGRAVDDLRHVAACPSFIEYNNDDVLNFYSYSEQKFNQTGDYRAYMQEKQTMAYCDGYHYAYMSFKISDSSQIRDICRILNKHDLKQSKLSFVTKHNLNGDSEHLLMIHKSDMIDCLINPITREQSLWSTSPLLQEMMDCAIQLTRPEWDRRDVSFIVPDNCESSLSKLCFRLDGSGSCIAHTEAGTLFIQCDVMLEEEMKNTLTNDLHIPFALYDAEFEAHTKDLVNQMFESGQYGEVSLGELNCELSLNMEEIER